MLSDNFKTILQLPQQKLKLVMAEYFKQLGYTSVVTQDGFVYAKGEIPVLLVAHLDTVHKQEPAIICTDKDTGIVMSPTGIGGDDRCGVYMISQIIQTHKCSVLLCEDEEIGMVGAGKFVKYYKDKKKKLPKFNYAVEIDRAGSEDCVFYDCANKEFETFVNDAGFVTKYGSFSDISEVAPFLGVAAVNISSGYYNPHTNYEYIDLNVVYTNIDKIKNMVDTPASAFEYVEDTRWSRPYAGTTGGYLYGRYDGDDYGKYSPPKSKPTSWDSRPCPTCQTTLFGYEIERGYCGVCGEIIDENYDMGKRCMECGEELVLEEEIKLGLCTWCAGIEEFGDTKICAHCGLKLHQPESKKLGVCVSCRETSSLPKCQMCKEPLFTMTEQNLGICEDCQDATYYKPYNPATAVQKQTPTIKKKPTNRSKKKKKRTRRPA